MRRRTVLLVEDNPITRKMFRLAMEGEGFAVLEAGSGPAALEQIATTPAELVIIDLVLPDMDGGELARQLRARPDGANLKLIAISGFQGLLDDAKERPGLFDACLCKPVETELLIQTLRTHLSSSLPSANSLPPGGRGHILVVDDDPVQLKLAQLQLQRHFGQISTASDGISAVARARSEPPDLILSDVMMPGLDGLELCLAMRRHPALAHVPIVLVSAEPPDAADADLARRMGASALLARTSGFEDLVPTLLALLDQPKDDSAAVEIADRLRLDHAERTRRQLDRQLMAQAEIGQREARLGAQLAILSGIADALTRSANVESTLGDVLTACLDAGGIDRCALYRVEDDIPRLSHILGFPESAREELVKVFGHPTLLSQTLTHARVTPISAAQLGEEEAGKVLMRAGVTAAMFVPLVGGGRCVGALLVGLPGVEPEPGQLAFVRAVGAYLGQALTLTEAFARERAARVLAEQANRAKDEFLAMLGHELRNPLTPIVTSLHLMRMRNCTVCAREHSIIERQVNHLTHLVDDLLDVARIARGKVEIKREPIEFAQCVASALEMASPLIEQHEHRLHIQVPSSGLVVDGDPMRLAQIVYNLITNAAKYTPNHGSIWINALCDGEEIVLSVRDSGIGITADMLPRVFDLFAQEHQALDRSLGGLGLGLSIVRNLVTLHGGTVEVRSAGHGHGSEFVIRLPLAAPNSIKKESGLASTKKSPDSTPISVPAGQRILIVDDNIDAAMLLSEVLDAQGHVTCVAHDGPAGLKIAAEFNPELALLDIGLPGMDGYELAGRLRQLPGLEKVRMFAVTGYGQESTKQRSHDAGFTAHLVKPVDLEELDRLIHGGSR